MERASATNEKAVGAEHSENVQQPAANFSQTGHAKINEAVAQGIAANVDDFMVRTLPTPRRVLK
jgi:hypothetical protein